ncbi:MAG TPA: hypothetical protein DDW42_01510 [Desulfobacteraceae bacterium]|nr:hypothetical protein [Desulfobacteraceae bacterium]
MLLPGIISLKGRANITFVGRKPGLYFMRDYVNNTIDFEDQGWHRLFMADPDREGLPVSETDLAIGFFKDRDGLIKRNLKVFLENVPVNIFDSLPPKGCEVHVARYVAECLKEAGCHIDPEKCIKAALKKALLKKAGPPVSRDKIILHPGSGDPRKNFSPDFWLNVAGMLGVEAPFKYLKPIFLLGPAETNLYPFFEKCLRATTAEIHFCPDHGQITSLLKKCALYLGHDTGITHLAAMHGIPTVALFRASRVAIWRPLGPFVRVIQNENAGAPDLLRRYARSLINSFAAPPFVLL